MKNWPLAITLPLVGVVAGYLVGSVFGNIGVAARGSAGSINTAIVLAIALAIIGYLVGRAKDKSRQKGPPS